MKIAQDLNKYVRQKLEPEKPKITIKMISKPNVATMIETHSKIDTIAIKVDNQMEAI